MMVDDKKGWESDASPDGYREFSSSGRGATAGGPESAADGGDSAPVIEPASAATAAEAQPERPPMGWGGKGENYPPAQGPNNRG